MNVNSYIPAQSISSFCRATREELSVIKNFYGLSLDEKAMIAIQKHFYSVEAREPSVDELALIDSFYRYNRKKASSVRINSVRSTDKNVGDAFDDIVKKLTSLGGKGGTPYSYRDLVDASQSFLDYLKDKSNYALVAHCGEYSLTDAMNDTRAANHVAVSCNGVKFTLSDRLSSVPDENASKICDSDNFVFLCKKDESDAALTLESAIFNLKKSLGSTILIKKVEITDESGIVGAVLRASTGAFLNFVPLSALPYSFSPRNLCAGLPSEAALAVVSSLSLTPVLSAAERFGLKAIPFGRPTKVKRLTITQGNGAPISVASNFLRGIAAHNLVCADVSSVQNNEYHENSDELSINGENESYVAHASGEKLISAVTLYRGGFVGAAESLIYALSKLVSCGVSPENVITTVAVSAKERSVGEILACITGIYRVRAELSIASCNDSVSECADNALTALAAAKGCKLPKVPHTFTAQSSKAYLLYPRMSEDGLPKFSDLRRLFAYVHELIVSGKALSVRAVGNSGLASCIRDMGNAECEIRDEHEKLAVCGSFVIESNEKIDGIELFSKNN